MLNVTKNMIGKNKNASALGKLSAKKRKDKKEHIEKMVIARKKKWEEWKLAKNKAVIEEKSYAQVDI